MKAKEAQVFFEHANEHYPISDKFILSGYRQKEGGYLDTAKRMGIEPHQKNHLLKIYLPMSFDDGTLSEEDLFSKVYAKLKCPELLLWIAEAAGISSKDVQNAAAAAEQEIKHPTTNTPRPTSCKRIREIISCDMIESRIIEHS